MRITYIIVVILENTKMMGVCIQGLTDDQIIKRAETAASQKNTGVVRIRFQAAYKDPHKGWTVAVKHSQHIHDQSKHMR